MNSNSVSSSVVLLLLLVGGCWASANSGESHQQKERRHSCGGLVQEPPASASPSSPPSSPSPSAPTMVPAPPPGECVCTPAPSEGPSGAPGSGEGEFHSHCPLIEAFYSFSVNLTIQQQVIWEAWIVEIENTILVNVELTDDEKVVQIAVALKQFFKLHVDIKVVLEYHQIAGWGTCRDFVYVAISIQIEITQSVVALNGSNSCPLLEALKNASQNCGCSSQDQSDLEALIAEIEALLGDSSYTYEQQLAVVWEHFEVFFESHVSLRKWLLQVNIEGYGSVDSFLGVCHTYKLIVSLSLSIGGTTVDDCALLAALDAASKNASYTPEQQLQIGQLVQSLQVYFQSTLDLKLRLQFVSAQCYQMFKLEGFMIKLIKSIKCEEWDGDVFDLIFCSGICTNSGCGNPNQGPGPQVQSTSQAPTSTASTSTAEPSTVAPTTTQMPADCSKCPSLIAVDSQNTTILTNVLLQNYNTWTLAKKSGFNSCFNSIRKAIWDNVNFPTVSSKLTGCRSAFNAYSTNNKAIQDEVFNIQITVWMGTIRQFVACT